MAATTENAAEAEAIAALVREQDMDEEQARAVRDAKRGGSWTSEFKRLRFYHGTSWESAQRIQSEGFVLSTSGCLGPGVYVGRRERALSFAQSRHRHGGEVGGLVTVIVSFNNPKFVDGDDTSWQAEGHDACRTSSTSFSSNMEWCIKDTSQLSVVAIERVPLLPDAEAPELEEPAAPAAPTAEASPAAAAPLTQSNLRKHAEVPAVRRQFNCTKHGTFWKKVRDDPPHKPVARCKLCVAHARAAGGAHVHVSKYEAIPREEERGRGTFECPECQHTWASNQACRGLQQYCDAEECTARDEQRGSFPTSLVPPAPRWLVQKWRAQRAQASTGVGGDEGEQPLPQIAEDEQRSGESQSHAGGGGGGGGGSGGGGGGGGGGDGGDGGVDVATWQERPTRTSDFDSAEAGTRARGSGPFGRVGGRGRGGRGHLCSGCATGACRRPPPLSAIHESTGSTAPTLTDATWTSAGSQRSASQASSARGARAQRGRGVSTAGRGRGRGRGTVPGAGSGSSASGISDAVLVETPSSTEVRSQRSSASGAGDGGSSGMSSFVTAV